jgi:hypothetical protein
MRIGTEGDLSRRIDLEAWAAQIAAMHLSVSRLTPGAKTTTQQDDQGVPTVGAAESLRAQVLSSRQGQMTAQDGLGYLQVAAADLGRSGEVLRRMRVVAAQAADGTFDAPQREALQKYVDRSVQELEGIAEQARYHTLKMLGGTASTWALPEGAPTQAAAVAPVVPAVTPPSRPGPAGQAGSAGQPRAAAVAPEGPASPQGSPGVAPVSTPSTTAVPPTARPDAAPLGGYEQRTPGVFAARAALVGTEPSTVDVAAAADLATRATPAGHATQHTGAFAGRAPIGTAGEARDLMDRLDTAADLLSRVGAAVDAAEQSLLRTIGALGLDEVRLPGDGDAPAAQQSAATNVLRQLTLQSAAQSSAAVLVEATRSQFDAVTTVLGGTAAAAAVGAYAGVAPRDPGMAARPSVEPVTLTSRSSRAETSRERSDRGGSGSGVARR